MNSIECYDNMGITADRYTVVFKNQRIAMFRDYSIYSGVSMSHNPYHPQGVCMWGQVRLPNENLGERIRLIDLPADCQALLAECLR
jgi:hypothetical protein